MAKPGFVYVLTNSAFAGLVKIGMTTQRRVSSRVKQIGTGVPTSFEIGYVSRVRNPAELEKRLHEHFWELCASCVLRSLQPSRIHGA